MSGWDAPRESIYAGVGDAHMEEPLTPCIVQTVEAPQDNRRNGNMRAHVQALTERLETLEARMNRLLGAMSQLSWSWTEQDVQDGRSGLAQDFSARGNNNNNANSQRQGQPRPRGRGGYQGNNYQRGHAPGFRAE